MQMKYISFFSFNASLFHLRRFMYFALFWLLQISEIIEEAEIPPVIIEDPAYPLFSWLMKGSRDNGNLTPEEKLFNHMLGKARMVIENTYGRLKGRWRCLLKRNDNNIDFVTTISSQHVAFCIICVKFTNSILIRIGRIKTEKEPVGLVIDEGHQAEGGDARNIRDALMRYFVNNFPYELQRFL